MKQRTVITCVTGAACGSLLAFSFAAAARAQTGEVIRSFAADMLVREDGRMVVTERIEYSFPTPRRGIDRDLPIRTVGDDGKTFETPIEVRGVSDGRGRPWKYALVADGNFLRLRIGEADRLASGDQTYVIEYVVAGALRYFGDHDELYWNVTGGAWPVPIRRVNANVRLPVQVAYDRITLKCFTGPTGSKAQECLGNKQGPSAQFASSVAPLTIIVGWPKGAVAPLAAREVKPFTILGMSPLIIPSALAIAAFVGMIVLRRSRSSPAPIDRSR